MPHLLCFKNQKFLLILFTEKCNQFHQFRVAVSLIFIRQKSLIGSAPTHLQLFGDQGNQIQKEFFESRLNFTKFQACFALHLLFFPSFYFYTPQLDREKRKKNSSGMDIIELLGFTNFRFVKDLIMSLALQFVQKVIS